MLATNLLRGGAAAAGHLGYGERPGQKLVPQHRGGGGADPARYPPSDPRQDGGEPQPESGAGRRLPESYGNGEKPGSRRDLLAGGLYGRGANDSRLHPAG